MPPKVYKITSIPLQIYIFQAFWTQCAINITEFTTYHAFSVWCDKIRFSIVKTIGFCISIVHCNDRAHKHKLRANPMPSTSPMHPLWKQRRNKMLFSIQLNAHKHRKALTQTKSKRKKKRLATNTNKIKNAIRAHQYTESVLMQFTFNAVLCIHNRW